LPDYYKDLVSGLWFVVSGFSLLTRNYKPKTRVFIIAFLVLSRNWMFFKGLHAQFLYNKLNRNSERIPAACNGVSERIKNRRYSPAVEDSP